MNRTLAFGLSGQLGAALLPLLDDRNDTVLALSRQPQPARAGIEWSEGSLESFGAPPDEISLVLSLGPLDAFADWVERVQPRVGRIVAIGSTGRSDKRDSPDPRDRDEARRLEDAERRLFECAAKVGIAVSVLRPTLLYGGDRDRSLSQLASFARRWRLLPLPACATGLRRPVHVADVAKAVLDCAGASAAQGRAFDLPGAEVLPFDTMVRRALAVHAPGARVLRLPSVLFRIALALAAALGKASRGKGWLWRVARDQLADPADAAAAFGFNPRPFEP